MLTEYTPKKSLRSSKKGVLTIHRINYKSARGTFSYYGPTLWNSAPEELRSAAAASTSKSKLETYFTSFQLAFNLRPPSYFA